jgi:hypothetical protein
MVELGPAVFSGFATKVSRESASVAAMSAAMKAEGWESASSDGVSPEDCDAGLDVAAMAEKFCVAEVRLCAAMLAAAPLRAI